MIENVQIIKENGRPRFAVLDYQTLRRLEELVEDALDVQEAEKILNNRSTQWLDFEEVKKKILVNPIREKRRERGFSQRELARRLGVHQSYVAKIERPDYNPSKKTLIRIAKSLGCRVEELL